MAALSTEKLQEQKMKLERQERELLRTLKRRKEVQNYSTQHTTVINDERSENRRFDQRALREHRRKLYEITRQVVGGAFENVDVQWVKDDVYMYTFDLVTESLSLHLSLKVKKKDCTEVLDIMCNFFDSSKYYMPEIMPWIGEITKMKNFPVFLAVVSSYNEQNLVRRKIVKKLEDTDCVSSEECTRDGGGLLLHVHVPDNENENLLTFHWSLLFVKRKCKIEHFFKILSSETGVEFVQEHKDLLNKFCKLGLSKKDLLDLWNSLCIEVKAYGIHAQNPSDLSG